MIGIDYSLCDERRRFQCRALRRLDRNSDDHFYPGLHSSGKLADRLGRKPFVVATFLSFALFPMTIMVASNLTLIVLAFVPRQPTPS